MYKNPDEVFIIKVLIDLAIKSQRLTKPFSSHYEELAWFRVERNEFFYYTREFKRTLSNFLN